MIDAWLQGIESLILTAPGNDDLETDDVWESTLTRLGEQDLDDAKARRSFFDFTESDDVAPSRPFFVIAEAELRWRHYNDRDLAADGAVEVVYTERVHNVLIPSDFVDDDAFHKASKTAFVHWTGNLIQSCAKRWPESGLRIASIEQTTPAIRTPRNLRDRDNLESDYWWCGWVFQIEAG